MLMRMRGMRIALGRRPGAGKRRTSIGIDEATSSHAPVLLGSGGGRKRGLLSRPLYFGVLVDGFYSIVALYVWAGNMSLFLAAMAWFLGFASLCSGFFGRGRNELYGRRFNFSPFFLFPIFF